MMSRHGRSVRRASATLLHPMVSSMVGSAAAEEEDEGGLSNEDRIRIMNKVKDGSYTIDQAAMALAKLEAGIVSPPSSAVSTPASTPGGSRRGSMEYSSTKAKPLMSHEEQLLIMMRVASGEITKSQAEAMIDGVEEEDEFDEPEYLEPVTAVYSSRYVFLLSSAPSVT